MAKKKAPSGSRGEVKTPKFVMPDETRWKLYREQAAKVGVIIPEPMRLDMLQPLRLERYLRAIDNHADDERAAALAGLHPDWVDSWMRVGMEDVRRGEGHEREVLNEAQLKKDPDADAEYEPIGTLAQFAWAVLETSAAREERLLSRLEESPDDRWAAWILEKTRPERYGRVQVVKNQVSGGSGGDAPVKVDHAGLPSFFIVCAPPLDDE